MSDLKIFTQNIEPEALDQIYTLLKQPAFANCKVRIMPDVHAGAGCVIGFTADLEDKVIPNIVGVDIGCGMLTVELGCVDIDLEKLDNTIRNLVPSGRNVHEDTKYPFPKIQTLHCFRDLKDSKRLARSIGTLGGGNHFIEIDVDPANGNKYLVIHTGSRNLGKQVADYYQNLAVEIMQGKDELFAAQEKLITEYKAQGRRKEIQAAIKELHRKFNPNPLGVPKELCYLTGKYRDAYLHDMAICQEFAVKNRAAIAEIILQSMGIKAVSSFETIHNYIELGSKARRSNFQFDRPRSAQQTLEPEGFQTSMVRKGAISAKLGEPLLIPINMRDGCILGYGKGNRDWNCSAPHGAGRIMSRHKAKETVSLEEYQKSMKGIYTTSVGAATIDEAPMVYKPLDEIVANIADTVEIKSIIKPIYNYKAGE